jgi:hypothetical protein
MPSSGIWRRVGLVRSDVSGEHVASTLGVEEISELATTSLAVISIPEDAILHSPRRQNFKSCKIHVRLEVRILSICIQYNNY